MRVSTVMQDFGVSLICAEESQGRWKADDFSFVRCCGDQA